MKRRVVVENGSGQGDSIELQKGQSYIFGRGQGCNLVLADGTASRQHFCIDFSGNAPIIRDMGSSNGTLINGTALTQHDLVNGDTIVAGDTMLRYEILNAAPVIDQSTPLDAHSEDDSGMSINLVAGESAEDQMDDSMFSQRFDVQQWSIIDDEEQDPQITKLAKRLNGICSFAGKVFTQQNISGILGEALDTALDLTQAQRASALLSDNESTEPVPFCARFVHAMDKNDFPVSRTIVRQTLETGESVISENTALDSRFSEGSSIAMQNISSVMCVPLMTLEEKILGVLYVDKTDAEEDFTRKELALFAAIGHQAAVAIERARLVDDLEKLFFGSILALTASIEAKDTYTRGHSERVTCYSLMIADEMGITGDYRNLIELSAVMHDVGKIGVPENVLCSPNRLSDEEFDMMKAHPARGAEIILNMPEIGRIASVKDLATSAKHHHEKYDGTGYPDGLSGENIPLPSRILAIADTFDAITSNRSYRKGRSMDEALKILHACAGTQVDPEILQAFERVCEKGQISRPESVKAHLKFNKDLLMQSTATPEEVEV